MTQSFDDADVDRIHRSNGVYLLSTSALTSDFQIGSGARQAQCHMALSRWVSRQGLCGGSAEALHAQDIVNSIVHVPLDTFMEQFDRSVDWLNATLPLSATYHLVVDCQKLRPKGTPPPPSPPEAWTARGEMALKSSAWLAQRARERMTSHGLRSVISVTHGPGSAVPKVVLQPAIDWHGANIVIADDAMFSGMQAADTIAAITEALAKEPSFVRSDMPWTSAQDTSAARKAPHGAPVFCTFWVVTPYRTLTATQRMCGKGLECVRSSILEAVGDWSVESILKRRSRPIAVRLNSSANMMHNIPPEHAYLTTRTANSSTSVAGRSLTLFEHKTPDSASFPGSLSRDACLGGAEADACEDQARKPYGSRRPSVIRAIRKCTFYDDSLCSEPRWPTSAGVGWLAALVI